jgi:hypothetical protein
MVMRIIGTTSCGKVSLFRGRRTGQEPSQRRSLSKERPSVNLSHRRRLRHAELNRREELASSIPINVDAHLLTGNLDQDISILNIVA